MDLPVLTLVIALFFAGIVEQRQNVNPPPRPEFSTLPPRRPPPLSPESPPLISPHPPLTPLPPVSQPPPFTPRPQLPPAPSFFPPPHPLQLSPHSHPPTPPLWSPPHSHPPPPPRRHLSPALPEHGNHNSYKNLSPPLEREKPNMGKKIGLMFIGVAAILQVCILAFLLIRRRQLLKSENGY